MTRLAAARALKPRAASKARKRVVAWPALSPGALNAWLLLVTTKPPAWREPLLQWPDQPLSLGEMHEGFLYPDPLGFWAEVRRWTVVLLQTRAPRWDASEALAVTALVHVGEQREHFEPALATCRPRVVLFLDEAAWHASGWDGQGRIARHHIADPHREGLVYQGLWVVRDDGLIAGKAPQHPSAHRFYRASDMDEFLRALPSP